MDEQIVSKDSLTESSKEALNVVKEVQKELSDYRRPFEKPWREQDDAYYGKQHKTGEEKKTVKNHIFKIIEGEVPILTDSMPGTVVTSSLEEKQGHADNLGKSIRYVYQDQNLPLILPTLMRSALTSAPGYLYAFYNPDAAGGDGKIEYRQLAWENVFLDGNAQLIEQSDKCRIEIPMRRDAIARMFHEKRDEIMGTQGKTLENGFGNDNREDRDVSGSDSDMGKPKAHKAKDIVKYVETWVKSSDLEPIPQEETAQEIEKENSQLLAGESPNISTWENHPEHIPGHAQARAQALSQIGLPGDAPIEEVSATIDMLLQSNPEAQDLSQILLIVKLIDNHIEEHQVKLKENPSGERPKYPFGWRLIKSVETVILYDGPNPEKNEHIPIVPFYCYKDTTIYGFSEVKNILDPQRTLNHMDWYEYEGLKVATNPGWVADHGAFNSKEEASNALTNEPGIVIVKQKGHEVSRLQPGQISPQLTERKTLDENAMEQISGMNEATQGQLPSSGASGVTVQKLQTQAIGRIRLKDRYLQHYSIRRLGIITASLIINHWTTEKRLRLRSDNSNTEEFIFNPIEMQDLEYTVDIADGSMAGIDKDALNNLWLQFFQASGGAMTFEDLLMVADVPKKEIILTRLKERNEQEAKIQEVASQLEALQMENAKLKGLVSSGALLPDEKKVFDMAAKQALLNELSQQEQAQQLQDNPGVNNGQPVMQGNI